MIGLFIFGSIAAYGSEVFTGVGYEWSYGVGSVSTDSQGNFPKAYSQAMTTAMSDCQIKYKICKLAGKDQKGWYAGVSNYAYGVTAVTVIGSDE